MTAGYEIERYDETIAVDEFLHVCCDSSDIAVEILNIRAKLQEMFNDFIQNPQNFLLHCSLELTHFTTLIREILLKEDEMIGDNFGKF